MNIEPTLSQVLKETAEAMEASIDAMNKAESELDRRAFRIRKLLAAMEEIEAYAQDKYDGPEDRHWGWVLARCQDARGR